MRGQRINPNKNKIVFFLLYVVVAIYFLNFKFPLLTVPEFISKFNDWIIVFGGFLILFSGLNFLLPRRGRVVY
jgi:cytochrome c biogenesis protein CcdA